MTQTKLKEEIERSIQNEKIAHAVLLYGKPGYNTLELALWYASKLICNNSERCSNKVYNLQHADLHLIYPLAPNDSNKKPVSSEYLNQFREFYQSMPYGNLDDWMNFVGLGKKRGKIAVQQASDIMQKVSLRSYEGGRKVVIIWYAELMGTDTANKLLKTLEEPPDNTYFLLICEKIDFVLPTILSRIQLINVPPLDDETIREYINTHTDLPTTSIEDIVNKSQSDIRVAHDLAQLESNNFDEVLVEWVRKAFASKKDLNAFRSISSWSLELAQWSRNNQMAFLSYTSEVFRQALLESYNTSALVKTPITLKGFNWGAFTKYIHKNNIGSFLEEINKASYDIERNVNAKIVFLDLSIKMTRLIHKSPND